MTRAGTSLTTKAKHRKLLKQSKGYTGRSNCYKIVKQKKEKGYQYSYRDRKKRKSVFRSDYWIVRINAAIRELGLATYSKFMHALKSKNIMINRKMLSEIAIKNPLAFKTLAEFALDGNSPDLQALESRHLSLSQSDEPTSGKSYEVASSKIA